MPVHAEPAADLLQETWFATEEELPLNSRIAAMRREQTAIEALVEEILYFDPDYAEQLALDGLNRMRH